MTQSLIERVGVIFHYLFGAVRESCRENETATRLAGDLGRSVDGPESGLYLFRVVDVYPNRVRFRFVLCFVRTHGEAILSLVLGRVKA
jgi:hypothetical protein